jgi:hypothetical protein
VDNRQILISKRMDMLEETMGEHINLIESMNKRIRTFMEG